MQQCGARWQHPHQQISPAVTAIQVTQQERGCLASGSWSRLQQQKQIR